MVLIQQYLYHDFTVEEGYGPVLLGEVSECNDDNTDNHFDPPVGRFPAIEEDEEHFGDFYLNFFNNWGTGKDVSYEEKDGKYICSTAEKNQARQHRLVDQRESNRWCQRKDLHRLLHRHGRYEDPYSCKAQSA